MDRFILIKNKKISKNHEHTTSKEQVNKYMKEKKRMHIMGT